MDTEIWKDIPGYEGKYKISSNGNVLSIISNKNLSFSDVDGYKRVGLLGKRYLVHRLVFCTFNNISLEFKGQKSKTLILHKNDKRDDNRIDNLFIGSQKDNVNDMMMKGRRKNGIIKKRKIGFSDIQSIKEKYEELGSIYKVAPLFGVSYATISRAINGKIWKIK